MGSEIDRSWGAFKRKGMFLKPHFFERGPASTAWSISTVLCVFNFLYKLDARGFVNNGVLQKRGFVLKIIYSSSKKTYII